MRRSLSRKFSVPLLEAEVMTNERIPAVVDVAQLIDKQPIARRQVVIL
jgi:hypothetical protein